MSNEISKKIVDGMLDLSVGVIRFVEKQPIPLPVINQLTRSITSIGANYSEAQDAASKRDFINKIYIAKKEAAESLYWLKLVEKLGDNETKNRELQDQTQRFVMILQKTINTTKTPSLQAKG
ncbi:MAG: four helix bundle protein [Candidatus Saccharimonadales bacterium]